MNLDSRMVAASLSTYRREALRRQRRAERRAVALVVARCVGGAVLFVSTIIALLIIADKVATVLAVTR